MFRRFRNYPQIGGNVRRIIPSDCVEVEWIKNSNNEDYIDTNIEPFLGIEGEIELSVDKWYYEGSLRYTNPAGAYKSGGNAFTPFSLTSGSVTSQSVYATSRYGNGTCFVYRDKVFDSRVKLSVNSSGRTINGKTVQRFSTVTNMRNDLGTIKIFSNIGTVSIGIFALYAFSLADEDGAKIIDLVPVRRVENGVSVGYMCDVLTGNLYGNKNSDKASKFMIGPDNNPVS